MIARDDERQEALGRRTPARDMRQRDAERSRELLLSAALDEFAAKGFAGARVQDIASRAGLNKQLITYYFGGKEGLYQALERRWLDLESTFARPDIPIDELAVEYLHAVLADPRLFRLLVWNGLAERGGPSDPADEDPVGHDDVADLLRRQQAGELASDLDPGLVLLALMGAIAAPIVLPQVVRRVTGLDFRSPEFEQAYAEQLRRIVQHLAE
ncbi:MAG TPA: TetR family transcriptional regulator [Thermomicrobiales bacterium]|nr:TetR family transcriptional regulator [Thermomicrobiales bacterium]